MLVKDLMSSYITSVKPEDPVTAAIACMRSENVGMVPVCDAQSHLLGVATSSCAMVSTKLQVRS